MRPCALAVLLLAAACSDGGERIDAASPAAAALPATVAIAPAATRCADDAEIQVTLDLALSRLGPPKQAGAATEVVERDCTRSLYRREDYWIVVSIDPVSRRGGFTLTNGERPRMPTAACLERTAPRAAPLIAGGAALIERARGHYGEAWSDPARGPAQWASCDASGEPLDASLATLLHELHHEVSLGSCIEIPAREHDLCFALDRALPPRSLGRLDRFVGDRAAREIAAGVERLYMDDGDIRMLLDEVVGYQIDMEVFVNQLDAGRIERGVMIGNHLAQLTVHVALYLERLKRARPALYAASFAAGPNREALLEILHRGDALCERRRVALRRAGARSYPHEARYWTLANAARARLGLR